MSDALSELYCSEPQASRMGPRLAVKLGAVEGKRSSNISICEFA